MDGTADREITSLKLEDFSQADKPAPPEPDPVPEGPPPAPAPEEPAPTGLEPGPEEPAPEPAEAGEAAPEPDAPAETEAPQPEKPPKPLTSEEVTGHTASLWKYLPVPEGEPEPSPEYLFGETDYPGSRIIGARVRGKKHKHEGTNCDDWYETASCGDITFLAVSDGAGSKRFSRIGAQVSCKAAAGYLVKAFSAALAGRPELADEIKLPLSDRNCMEACGQLAKLVQESVVKAYEAVEAAWYQRTLDPAFPQVLGRELELNDLSGTLLVTAVVPVDKETGEHLIISCQVGDGMIAILNTKGDFSASVKLMGKPDSGDFSGETEFLTSPRMHLLESLQSRTKLSRGIVDLVLVMSDGVADDYFPNETEMRRLYYDLTANGIIPGRGRGLTLAELSQQQIRQFKKLPDPLVYPWVNDQSVKISLHYTTRICEAFGLSLEELWADPAVLELARLELDDRLRAAPPAERLKLWLDNYVERGSFDDRTLVIAQI